MLTVTGFYAEPAWGLPFGAVGTAYTIVKGRHIGLDIQRTGDVPALRAGTVTAVLLTSAMAWCVEVVDAFGLRLTYCHLANDTLPKVGDVLGQGARVGRLARGPKTRPLRDTDFPGTAWTGQHLHLVASRIPRAAWQLVAGRTLADFTDPEILIRQTLAAPAGTASEGDTTMLKDDPDLQARLNQITDFMASNFTGLTGVVQAEGGTTRQYVDQRVSDLAGWTRDDANSIRATLATAGADPAAIAAALAPLIPTGVDARAVADELAKRLAG